LKGLKLRDARAEDRQAVLDFCRSTWQEYGDYIPQVWQEWLDDRGGRLIVAELGNRPVGLAKVTEFSEGEIWLEGLRVSPGYRHRGIARALNLEVLRTVRRIKPKVVRFCTGRDNRPSRRMAERKGFKVVAWLRYYFQKSRQARPQGEHARKRDIGALHDFILNSRFLRLTSGLIAEGWVFREFSRALLTKYVEEKRVMMIRKSGGLTGVAVYPYEVNERALTLGFVDGDERSIRILAKNCRYLAALQGLIYCSLAVPSRGFPRIVERAGYRRKDSIGQVVYELSGGNLKALDLK
jgi:ribosomal protein S18 acetylase RimI-like enzyme